MRRSNKKNPKKDNAKQTGQTKNVRVYELAKQYEVSSKKLIEELQGYGIKGKVSYRPPTQ